MSRLVLDASAAVRMVLRAPGSDRLADEVETAALVLVPSILISEVANALWKYASIEAVLTIEQCAQRMSEVDSLIDEVLDDRELIVEALHEAIANSHPVYDLLYAVLARRTGAAVLTCDTRLTSLLDVLGIAHRGVLPG